MYAPCMQSMTGICTDQVLGVNFSDVVLKPLPDTLTDNHDVVWHEKALSVCIGVGSVESAEIGVPGSVAVRGQPPSQPATTRACQGPRTARDAKKPTDPLYELLQH